MQTSHADLRSFSLVNENFSNPRTSYVSRHTGCVPNPLHHVRYQHPLQLSHDDLHGLCETPQVNATAWQPKGPSKLHHSCNVHTILFKSCFVFLTSIGFIQKREGRRSKEEQHWGCWLDFTWLGQLGGPQHEASFTPKAKEVCHQVSKDNSSPR